MNNRSKLLKLTIRNIGCIGPEGLELALDDVLCLVGKNNAGKSTVLRAYELAHKPTQFADSDRCTWAPDDALSEVELDVHIPAGIANIPEKWKKPDGENLVVTSRWQWSCESPYAVERTTWDPEAAGWSTEKAAGLDTVFSARLPRPLRVGSLQDAATTEETLLALVLTPFVEEVVAFEGDPESVLSKAKAQVVEVVEELTKSHQERFDDIAAQVHDGFKGVFPDLTVRLNIGMAPPPMKLKDLLEKGSGLRVSDGNCETGLAQQGTGARRALFWSMLQVHNRLTRSKERLEEARKALVTREKKQKDAEEKAKVAAMIAALDDGSPIPDDENDPALPGYLLLIDEPENALHPMAARAAQRHLYELANDPEWQVMMTTHSPYFVNPLAKHTTIARLERKMGSEGPVTPQIYRADNVKFSDEEREQLQALQQMDVGFSEVFFGSYPIVVEGDTEHAAFLGAVVEEGHDLAESATVIRARGKGIIPALIRMLAHFKVDFGLLHDVDWPYTEKGKASGMWGTNASIFVEVLKARADSLTVRYACSVPDFERLLGGEELGRDKPLAAYRKVRQDQLLRDQVQTLFKALTTGPAGFPFDWVPGDEGGFKAKLLGELTSWAAANGEGGNIRLIGSG